MYASLSFLCVFDCCFQVIAVSMGFGVVQPELSSGARRRLFIFGALYLIFETALEVTIEEVLCFCKNKLSVISNLTSKLVLLHINTIIWYCKYIQHFKHKMFQTQSGGQSLHSQTQMMLTFPVALLDAICYWWYVLYNVFYFLWHLCFNLKFLHSSWSNLIWFAGSLSVSPRMYQ